MTKMAVVEGSRLDRLAEGQRIIRRLIGRGMTRQQIAAALEMRTSKSIGDWERGLRAPLRKRLDQLRELDGDGA